MFNYDWKISDGYPAKGVDNHKSTVMTTFACGGGSSMGYKLAGYDVVAANDIDPKMAAVYEKNHKPNKFYLCPVETLLKKDDLPTVDVLDGSPPCSVFSMAGSREKAWQKEKHFKEGQAKQVLDDLFFDFIRLAEKMNPKVVVAENVKGMLIGNARWYTREVVRQFKAIGYDVQVFLLNGATMGVPQRRERVFFIANRLGKKIKLDFNEKPITFGEIRDAKGTTKGVSPIRKELLKNRRKTDTNISHINERLHDKVSGFNAAIIHDNRVAPTITSAEIAYRHYDGLALTTNDYARIGTFPADYNYLGVKPKYLIGMSVPPVMMSQVAHQIYKQILEGV